MKTSDLRKYRKNIEALEAIDRLLSGKIVTDSVQGSHGAPDYALTHRRVEGLPQDKGTVSLLKAKADILREQSAIKTFINGIKERRIYEALYFYCLDESLNHPTWEDVAEKMHEKSAESLRKCTERHLEINFKNVRLFP